MSERKGKKFVDPTKKFVVHPDILEGLKHYTSDNDSLKRVFQGREDARQSGVVYWNTEHDQEMIETAKERSLDPRFIKYCRNNNIVF